MFKLKFLLKQWKKSRQAYTRKQRTRWMFDLSAQASRFLINAVPNFDPITGNFYFSSNLYGKTFVLSQELHEEKSRGYLFYPFIRFEWFVYEKISYHDLGEKQRICEFLQLSEDSLDHFESELAVLVNSIGILTTFTKNLKMQENTRHFLEKKTHFQYQSPFKSR